MKIINFVAKDVKNIRAIQISPEDENVVITGANGAGKSNILDTIMATLGQLKLNNPIRDGADRGEAVVELMEPGPDGKSVGSNIFFRRLWTKKSDFIEVYTLDEEGKKSEQKKRPIEFSKALIGRIAFDPLEVAGMKSKDRVEILKNVLNLNFDDLNAKYEEIYFKRTGINTLVKDSLARLKSIEPPDPDIPTEEVSFKLELQKVNQLREKRDTFNKYLQRANAIKTEILELERNIDIKQKEIATMKDDIEKLNKSEWVQKPLPPKVTDEQINEAEIALSKIEDLNVKIRAAKRYRADLQEAEKRRREADKLTQELKRIDQDKSTRIANAKFPIEGLSFADEDLSYKGKIFEDLSTGEKIRISTAIGMALNPTLKVIFIREGSRLDRSGHEELFALAKEKDYQIWEERMDESGDIGIYIEDGGIVKIDGKEVN